MKDGMEWQYFPVYENVASVRGSDRNHQGECRLQTYVVGYGATVRKQNMEFQSFIFEIIVGGGGCDAKIALFLNVCAEIMTVYNILSPGHARQRACMKDRLKILTMRRA